MASVVSIPFFPIRSHLIPKDVLKRAAPYQMQKSHFDLLNSVCPNGAKTCCEEPYVINGVSPATNECITCQTIHLKLKVVSR